MSGCHLGDKLLPGQRLIIETINDQLKKICHLEHSGQRSPVSFRDNLIVRLIFDTWKEKKPFIRMPQNALTAW
ncbi:MAG: transposase [Candidatus Poribacteria bacterium]|nr:transposase [Candidatus Poribacteria bacterium]MDP6998551.1 transposase [Candidatus Poribacteria bacterium]